MVAEKDRPFFKLFAAIEASNIVIAFIANIILIVIIFKSTKDLSSYRYLLLAFAVNDLCFPVVHALTLPVICSYHDAFLMFSNGILTSKVSICLFAAVCSQTMPIMTHLFVYRLIVLRWPNAARFYTASNSFLLIASTVLSQLAMWFSNCWFNYDSDDELRNYVQPFLDADFPGEGQGHIGVLYYNENGIRISALMATLGFDGIMMFWCTIIGFCTVLIVKSFKGSTGKHAFRTQQLQKQLFKTLMIIPIISVYLPCAGIINAPILVHISESPSLVSAALSLFPVVDAIITLIGVKIFRKHIVTFLRKTLKIRIEQSSTAVTSIPGRQ